MYSKVLLIKTFNKKTDHQLKPPIFSPQGRLIRGTLPYSRKCKILCWYLDANTNLLRSDLPWQAD